MGAGRRRRGQRLIRTELHCSSPNQLPEELLRGRQKHFPAGLAGPQWHLPEVLLSASQEPDWAPSPGQQSFIMTRLSEVWFSHVVFMFILINTIHSADFLTFKASTLPHMRQDEYFLQNGVEREHGWNMLPWQQSTRGGRETTSSVTSCRQSCSKLQNAAYAPPISSFIGYW